MRVMIRTFGPVPAEMVELARERIGFAVGRFSRQVRWLSVRLRDVNGPRGGVDKQCVVAARLAASPRTVMIQDIDAEFAPVIARAADRAGRAVARAIHAGSTPFRGVTA